MNEHRIKILQRNPRINWRENQFILLEFLSNGYSYADIGRELGTSGNTVRGAANRLYEKLGADNSCHAIAIAYQRRILKLEP